VAKTSRINFTKKALEKLPATQKRYNVFDLDVSGLGVAVYPSGARSFFHLKKVRGWPERTAIGTFPDLSVEQARGKASELNAKLAKWRSDGYQGRSPVEGPPKVVTLGEVLAHYIEHHLRRNARNPDEAVKYALWQFARYLGAWRNRPMVAISRKEIAQRHSEIETEHGGVTANRAVTFLRTLFNHGLDPDYALFDGLNPARKPKKLLFHETARKVVLRDAEARKFFAALENEPHRDLRDFLLLALSTGARRGTLFRMQWEEIDFRRGLWTITSPKGRRGQQEHIVPLNAMALRVLRARPRANAWVFPGRAGHLTTVKKPWKQFRERAGITDLHIHDLRRTLATRQGESGASAEIIQRTLGHVGDSEATKIYDRSQRRDDVRHAIDAGLSSMLTAGKTSRRKLLKARP
jgi:integrase